MLWRALSWWTSAQAAYIAAGLPADEFFADLLVTERQPNWPFEHDRTTNAARR
jgi:hypothetical protein